MQRRIYINGNSLGWPERIMVGVLGVLFLLLGLAFGAVILSLAAVAGLGLAARVWWLRRQLLRQQPKQPHTQSDVRVIEGEYRVLERKHNQHSWR
jgi:hypothetical protein